MKQRDGRVPHRDAPGGQIGWQIVLILAAGLVARVPRLLESLWYDEIASYILYASKGPWYVVSNYHDPSNHIFHSLLTWGSIELFAWLGTIEFAFRLPALAFSLLTIVIMRELGRDVANERVGWIAALLAAALPVNVLEGADARGYSMMILFSAASSWALLKGLRERSPRTWIVYAILCALGAWSHLMTLFVPIGHGVLLVGLMVRGSMRARARAGLIALAGAAGLTLLFYAPALADVIDFYLAERGFAATSGDQPLLVGPEGFRTLLQLGGSWYWWAAVPGLTLSLAGVIIAIREERYRLALAATFLGFFVVILVVAFAGSWIYARFALSVLPASMLLMSLAIDWLWARNRIAGSAMLGVMCVACAADLLVRPPRQPLRDAVEFVLAMQDDASPVVAIGLNVPDIAIYEPSQFEIVFTTHAGNEFEMMIAASGVRHVIVSYPHLLRQPRLRVLADEGFERAAALPGWADWGRGEVWVYQRRKTVLSTIF